MKEDVFDLEHSCVEMSMMEREELDPQLDCTKKELFSALRHSRKKIESLQEAFDVQMSKQQHELVECCIRVGTLEKMLAQRELQLMSLLEERNSLQAEKDSLKMELQHLERQHYKELMEAQRKADALMVQELSIQRQQLDKEKDEALNSLWTRLTQEHTEELCRLKYAHWTEGEAAASLHRELKAKDQELRQLQMSMDEWKQQTTAHLADSVTEKLIPELESCKSKLIRDR
ncbi:intermediate filament protein ifb-2-like [Cyprinodon tularosa]|uniref:intermediate filament protein ifb-2-like n=1 Tax=Cyprinodon tularosa TaxID=77115 RepID=UPI0018E26642|nr:intermediate filament protein ifb-2-like [Cyprinodon tularosa]